MKTPRIVARLATCAALSTLAGACAPAAPPAPAASFGAIERITPGFDAAVPQGATIEVLAEGFAWSEGPVWQGSRLLFSDVPNNRIHAWSESEGLTTWLEPSGNTGEGAGSNGGSNGLLLDAEGRLVLCQHGDRRVARLDAPLDAPEPRFTTMAGEYGGRRLNSPNDASFAPDGSLWFTDPPYGLPAGDGDPAKELDSNGVYALRPDGRVDLVVDSLARPNGIAFSPDGATVYVAQSQPGAAWILAYDVTADGMAANGRVLFDASPLSAPENPGLPDGLKVSGDGTLFATGPGGVLVLSPAGEHLGTIRTVDAAANVAFGPDEDALYITASSRLLRIRLSR